MTTGAATGRRRRAAGGGPWLAQHPVEIAFALLVGAAFVYSLRITRGRTSFSRRLAAHHPGRLVAAVCSGRTTTN